MITNNDMQTRAMKTRSQQKMSEAIKSLKNLNVNNYSNEIIASNISNFDLDKFLIELQNSIIIPSNIIQNQTGLFVKKYKCKFGKFPVTSLYTYNDFVKNAFTRYSRFNGYSIKWFTHEDGSHEITKMPMALLAQIVFAQNEENCKKMIGAWPISSYHKCSAYNVIESIIIDNKQHKINKFSLYYPRAYDKNQDQEVNILRGVSFRTAIFDAQDINEARHLLHSLYHVKFKGITIDGSEDAIYPNKNLSNDKIIKYINNFVHKMKTNEILNNMLRKSYNNNNMSLLEFEWNLIKNSLNQ